MVHAHLDPRSFGPDTETVQPSAKARQAAEERAAYIKRIVDAAPPLTAAQTDLLAGIFSRNAERTNATAGLSVSDWVKWENKRYLEATEAPGIHGTYGDEVAA